MQINKAILTNVSALRAKYGAAGYARIRSALADLAASDRARGLTSRLFALDSAAQMKTAGGKAVAGPHDQRGAKDAIDAIHRKFRPDYLLILGAPDVVPHVDLNNPMKGTPDDDGDEHVPSDAPYACDAAWSRNPARFLGPSRVVGRLPDQRGAKNDPGLLLKLIGQAARHKTRDRSDYKGQFALSAKVWQKSTRLSVETLFGAGTALLTSPPDGPAWKAAQLAPRLHFINCHGDTLSPKFFGEFPRGKFFDAHEAARLRAKVTEGSVIAAECCYGAELYDPADAEGKPGICSTYLQEGAYGFFGSTNIAYGPAEGNGQADLICRFFLEGVLGGASIGRAAAEAHQRFVAQFSHLDPSDVKTAVQFILLGDPSIHPVRQVAHSLASSRTVVRATKSGALRPGARAFRRERLNRTGKNLERTVGAAVVSAIVAPAPVRELLAAAARESGIRAPVYRSYRVQFPVEARTVSAASIEASRRQRTIHVVLGGMQRAAGVEGPLLTAIIATVEGRRIVHLRRVHSR